MAKIAFHRILAASLFTIVPPAQAVQSVQDGFDPDIPGVVRAAAILGDGKILVGGEFSQVSGAPRQRLARLNWDGTFDSSFQTGANGTVRTLLALPDGTSLVGGEFTTLAGNPRAHLARLTAAGALDPGFAPSINGAVHCLLRDPDGAVVVGGSFTLVNDVPRNGAARLLPDGSVDPSFNPVLGSASAVTVNALVRQTDGKLLVAGRFETAGGAIAQNLARLHPNASRDGTFHGGSNGEIFAAALQADGRVVIGGDFTQASGTSAPRLARLNRDGSFQAALATLGDRVNAIAVQPDGKLIVGGRFGASGGGGAFLFRLLANLTLDASYQPAAQGEVFSCTVQSDGHLMAGGAFSGFDGVTRRGLARADSSGEVDATWNPSEQITSGPVYTAAQQPDEKLMLAGGFGQAGGLSRSGMGRVNANGVGDPAFLNPALGSDVTEMQVRRDRKYFASGSFTTASGQARRGIARLNSDGTPDSFNVNAQGLNPMFVTSLCDVPDGIVLSGTFTSIGGSSRNSVAKVSDAGALNSAFNPGSDGPFFDMIRLPASGDLIVMGGFSTVAGVRRPYLQRLTSAGVPVSSFNPAPNGQLSGIHLLPEDKILAWGSFRSIGGQSKRSLARLSLDGDAEAGFGVQTDGDIYSAQVQADGSMYVMGPFTTINGQARQSLARLLPDGTLDSGFATTFDGSNRPRASLIQQDGKLLAFGEFFTVGGVSRRRMARFSAPGPAIQELGLSGSGHRMIWKRSGTSPEMERVWFSYSSDGVTYSTAREGSRVAGGWDSGDFDFPNRTVLWLRAEGRVPTASGGSAGGLLESIRQVYLDGEIEVLSEGRSLINGAEPVFDFGRNIQGTPAGMSFAVVNRGNAPMRLDRPVPPAGYTVTGIPFDTILSPGEQVTITVTLSSTIPGIHAGELHLPNSDLDEADFMIPLSGEVYIPDPVTLLTSTETELRRQTGLREQTIRVSNPTTATVPAYRVILRGLPAGVEVYNASEVRPDGSVVVEVLQPLSPSSSFDLVIEYYSASRRAFVADPQVSTEVILIPPDNAAGGGDASAILRSLSQADGSFLVEFSSVPGRRYQIEYSADNLVWKESHVPIRAAGTRVQWVDRGPPRTEAPPAEAASRFYRVRELAG